MKNDTLRAIITRYKDIYGVTLMINERKSIDVRRLTYVAMLTALVVILQLAGSFIKLGMFSVSLVLVPIVIGSAICGPWAGAWLGLVFSVTVLVSGDASAFLAVDPFGTVVTVILKGTLAGLVAGLVYILVSKLNRHVAVFVSAVVCPLVNTGIFLLGCLVFFMDTISEWAVGLGFENVYTYMIVGLVGANFLFEVLFNIILAPVIVILINLAPKLINKNKQ